MLQSQQPLLQISKYRVGLDKQQSQGLISLIELNKKNVQNVMLVHYLGQVSLGQVRFQVRLGFRLGQVLGQARLGFRLGQVLGQVRLGFRLGQVRLQVRLGFSVLELMQARARLGEGRFLTLECLGHPVYAYY